jgi:hypothetical protein
MGKKKAKSEQAVTSTTTEDRALNAQHPGIIYNLEEITLLMGWGTPGNTMFLFYPNTKPGDVDYNAFNGGKEILAAEGFGQADVRWYGVHVKEDPESSANYRAFFSAEVLQELLSEIREDMSLTLNLAFLISIKSENEATNAFKGMPVKAVVNLLDRLFMALRAHGIHSTVNITFFLGDTLQAYNYRDKPLSDDEKHLSDPMHWQRLGREWQDAHQADTDSLKAKHSRGGASINIEYLSWETALTQGREHYQFAEKYSALEATYNEPEHPFKSVVDNKYRAFKREIEGGGRELQKTERRFYGYSSARGLQECKPLRITPILIN